MSRIAPVIALVLICAEVTPFVFTSLRMLPDPTWHEEIAMRVEDFEVMCHSIRRDRDALPVAHLPGVS